MPRHPQHENPSVNNAVRIADCRVADYHTASATNSDFAAAEFHLGMEIANFRREDLPTGPSVDRRKDVDWITDKIAIGNYVDGADKDLLERSGIRSILCLDCNIPATAGMTLARHVVHLFDAPTKQLDNFKKAVLTLERLVAGASPVLVHCHAGRSRSVVVVAAFIMRAQGCGPEEAISIVRKKREAAITPGVEQLLYYL